MKAGKFSRMLCMGVVAVICVAGASLGAPVGTGFTYQGRLVDGEDVADGLYDFEFRLYDAASDGNQVGPELNAVDVDVIDGYFTAELDFGSVFDGNAVWLDIGVRAGELVDPNEYTLLSPRQLLTATPFALYSLNGGSSGGESLWQTAGDNIFFNGGNVGIGTSTPSEKLTIENGGISVTDLSEDGVALYARALYCPEMGYLGYAGVFDGPVRAENTYVDNLYVSDKIQMSHGEFEAWGEMAHFGWDETVITGDLICDHGLDPRMQMCAADFKVTSRESIAVRGRVIHSPNYGPGGYGGYFLADVPEGTGVYGLVTVSTGLNYAVRGRTESASGYAGYFEGGRNYFEGNVGIGTSEPSEKLDVNGVVKATAFLGDGSGLTNLPAGSELWAEDGGNIYRESGNVGIGITEPSEKLEVSGAIKTDSGYVMSHASMAGMKIECGSGVTDGSGTSDIILSDFSSTPVFIVTCSQLNDAYRVNGAAMSASWAQVKSWNRYNAQTGPVTFDWIAIGQ